MVCVECASLSVFFLLGHELLAVYINGCSSLCNVTDWEIWHMSFHTGFKLCIRHIC